MELFLSEPKVYFCVASFFMALVVLCFSCFRSSFKKSNKLFILFLISIIIADIAETTRTLSYHFPYAPDSTYFFPRFIQSLNFITSTFMLLTGTLYVNSLIEKPNKFSRAFVIINVSLFIVYTIFCILNIKLGWIVSYDPNIRKYDLVRGPLYSYVGYSVPVSMIIMIIVVFIKNINYYPKQTKVTIVCALFSCSIFMLLQPFVAKYVTIVPFGVTVSIFIWYLAIENGDYKNLQKTIGKLTVAQQEALEANRAKNAFLANMSHEIRTPLNVILGLGEMIQNSNSQKEIHDYATDIYDSGKNLLSVINNILDYSKLEFGKLEIIEAEYHLWDFLENIKAEFLPLAKEKNLDFVIEVDENLSDNLYGDSYHLTQILHNIISNSFKYTSEGSIKLSVKGTEDNSKAHLIFDVTDTGGGIRDEDLPQLFHGFQHLDKIQRSSIQGGTGLGLAICHKLISLLCGSISFKTKENVGTRFSVHINQKIIAEGTVKDRKIHTLNQAEEIAEHISAPNCNVLIVDDNSMNLVVASGLLKKTEAKIHTCESGRTCLELMKKEKYDIIFMDHFMPDMDGVETYKQSKEMPGNLNLSTPVVILTANYSPKLHEYYSGEGFADYIYKPIDRDRLYEVFFRTIPKELIIKNN